MVFKEPITKRTIFVLLWKTEHLHEILFAGVFLVQKICYGYPCRPYSLMDKTRGFYPFDVGSIPTGGTAKKIKRLLDQSNRFIF